MSPVDVDKAKAEISLAEAAQRCGVPIDVHGHPPNVRIDCPFNCPGDHDGKRELSVNVDHPDKLFRCHNYQCQFRGNLVHLMHGWLTGTKPPDGRVRGDDFKRVKAVLVGEANAEVSQRKRAGTTKAAPEEAPAARNVPLDESDNEKARELVGMEELLTSDVEQMTPACSAYWRGRRHFLTKDLCEAWGVGVRPGRTGADKRGWTLRNHVVYRFLSEDDKVLCYVGRDPEFDDKSMRFDQLPPERRDPKKRPMKHKIPAGFHRGLELYGQHRSRLADHPEYREFIAAHGIIVVEGFNDVLALDHVGIPAVGLCSNRMTEQQAAKVVRWANRLAGGRVSLLFDCEETGDDGAKETLWLLNQIAPELDVRLGWSQRMHYGRFKGRQPENLDQQTLEKAILPLLKR